MNHHYPSHPATDAERPEVPGIPSNMGLHGNCHFYETGHHQLRYEGRHLDPERGSIEFIYRNYDSEEGQVSITYTSTCGRPADDPAADGFDVDISTGSDVWDLEDTLRAIQEAVKLHRALGHNKPYDRDYYRKD